LPKVNAAVPVSFKVRKVIDPAVFEVGEPLIVNAPAELSLTVSEVRFATVKVVPPI
jgi:hypothetical protein